MLLLPTLNGQSIGPGVDGKAGRDASCRIMPGDVRALVPVAVEAGQGKIVDGGGTSMLARDNVIDVKWQGIDGRWKVAVFAAAFGSLPDLPGHIQVH